MHFVLVLDVWDPRRGGLEAYARELACALRDASHRVTVVTAERRAPDASEDSGFVELGARGPRFYRDADEACAAMAREGEITTLAFRHPAPRDVFLPLGGLLAASLNARRASEAPWVAAPRRLARALSARTRAFLARERRYFTAPGDAERLVLANSPLVAQSVRARYPRFAGRVEVEGLPVDLDRFAIASAEQRARARAALAAACGASEEDRLLLFVGHDAKRKGLRVARGVLARLHQRKIGAKLLIAGRGSEACSDPGRGIHGLGFRESMRELYDAADVLLAPSLEDNYSLCVLEAMASGVPVVTSAANGVASTLDDARLARVVRDPRDVSDFDAACLALLDAHALDPERREARRALVAAQRREAHFARVLALLERT